MYNSFPFPVGAVLRRPDGSLGVVRKIQHVDHADADYATIEDSADPRSTAFLSPWDVTGWRQESRLSFGVALDLLKAGRRVRRAGWNGKGMWLALVSPPAYGQKRGYALTGDPDFVMGARCLPWIGMKTADDCFVPWLASQTDLLSEDYEVVS